MEDFTVREFRQEKYLSTVKRVSKIIGVQDIGEVADCGSEPDGPHETMLQEAKVVGVYLLDKYKIRLRCRERVEYVQTNIGKCCRENYLSQRKEAKGEMQCLLCLHSSNS